MTILEATPVATAAAQVSMPPSPILFPDSAPAAPVALFQPAAQPRSAPAPGCLVPASLDEAYRLAEYIADSTFVPKDYQGKPGNVFIAIQWGMEIGLKPLQALQNIAVINGRPGLWGDAILALVQAHPSCVDVIESFEGVGDQRKAICIAQRRGRKDKIGDFSMADARKAELLGKDTWKKYTDRMLKMRARAFALRDQFTDVLKGLSVVEELQDIETGSYFSDAGPDGRLNGGSTRPGAPMKGSEIAAANRPQLSEDGAAEIVLLTNAAKLGYDAFKVRWQSLPESMRMEIGIEKRNELSALGAEVDSRRKAKEAAQDVTPKAEGATA